MQWRLRGCIGSPPVATAVSRKQIFEKLTKEVEKLQRDFVQMEIRLNTQKSLFESMETMFTSLQTRMNTMSGENALLRKAVVHLYQEAGVECPASFGLPVMTQKILHPSETIQSKK